MPLTKFWNELYLNEGTSYHNEKAKESEKQETDAAIEISKNKISLKRFQS